MINFLYCFDSNYITQAKTSINSLLSKVSQKINIYIICDDINTSNEVVDTFSKHPNLKEIKSYFFQSENYEFPNLEGTHVSAATYFRIFIDHFLPKNLKQIVYLDADIICLKDPIETLSNYSIKLEESNYGIAALTEGTRIDSPIIFEKLKLKNNNYFNAGVLIIDYKFWISNDVGNLLMKILIERKDEIIFWDQDILNMYFDDKYLKFSKVLNYNFTKLDLIENKEIVFLHYAGKGKPWDVENITKDFSKIYQKEYSKIGKNYYHIVFNRNKKTLISFLKILLKLEFMVLEKPFKYITLSIKSLLKK